MAASNQLPIGDFLVMIRDTGEQLAAATPGGWGLPDEQLSEAHPYETERQKFPSIQVHCRPVKHEYNNVGRQNVGAADFAMKVWYQFDCICSVARDTPITLTGINGGLPFTNYLELIQLQHDLMDIVMRNWPTALVTDATRVGTMAFVGDELVESPDMGNVWRGRTSFVLPIKHTWT